MYETIPVNVLDQWLEQGYRGRIVDLRDPDAYAQSHLYGAENFPYEWLMENPSVLEGTDAPVLFYCSRGSESMLACNYFSRTGLKVYNLGGGYRFYRGKYNAF